MGGEPKRSNSGRNGRKEETGSRRKSRDKDVYRGSDYSTSESEEDKERRKKRHNRSKKRHKPRKARRTRESSDQSSSEEDDWKGRDKKRSKRKKRELHDRRLKKKDRKNKHLDSSTDTNTESCSSEDVVGEIHNLHALQKIIDQILRKFPTVKEELRQLLKMMDDGQAVDIKEISSKSLAHLLKKLFQSLNLKKIEEGIYLLPEGARPSLEIVGSFIQCDSSVPLERQCDNESEYLRNEHNKFREKKGKNKIVEDDVNHVDVSELRADSPSLTKHRIIGPAVPSAEMLAAAAKLTEAESALREAEKELENDILIGPPPPAAVAEAESANDAERFEEVSRIIALDLSNPYEVLGMNRKGSAESIKKRYWKLSLLVHPDKCSHPEAHQAFTILNQAFKDLQDPTKRASIDDKIIAKEEQEEFEAELKAHREAAQWRRIRGEALPGDDELLGEGKMTPKRDEWMTMIPPERKAGTSMHSTFFSKSEKSQRGDTSVWTDTPLEKAQKAKMHYLEAYNQAALTTGRDDNIDTLEKKHSSAAAELIDKYNNSKRSMSLLEKHQQEQKKKSRKVTHAEKVDEEWSGKHPWKPWNRETDLSAGRQNLKHDAKSMEQGLASRFSSGNVERKFL